MNTQRNDFSIFPIFLLTMVPMALLALSNIYQLGKYEYYYQLNDSFFYARRGILVVFGIVGIMCIRQTSLRETFKLLFQKTSDFVSVILAIFFGIIAGLFSPQGHIQTPFLVLIFFTCFHVLSEEVFFRGFATEYIHQHISQQWISTFLSALYFGLYHLSYYGFWYDLEPQVQFHEVGIITLGAGIPLAMLYLKTKSITAPIFYHLCMNLTMNFLRVYG